MFSCFVVFCRVFVHCCGAPAVFDEYVVVDYIQYMLNLMCTTVHNRVLECIILEVRVSCLLVRPYAT